MLVQSVPPPINHRSHVMISVVLFSRLRDVRPIDASIPVPTRRKFARGPLSACRNRGLDCVAIFRVDLTTPGHAPPQQFDLKSGGRAPAINVGDIPERKPERLA